MRDRTPTALLRVRLFGEPAVLLPDGRSVALERRAAALLALAALEPGIGRLRLATLLWLDSNDPRRNLRQQLLRFRQMFGRELLTGTDALRPAAGTLFDAPGDGAPGAGVLLAGLDYADLDEFDAWLQAQRSAQRARRAKGFEEAIARAENDQRLGDAIASAQQQLADEPTAEAHHRTLIRLHYLDQDMARARSAFQALRQMLEDELGASPSAETMALMRLVDERGSRVLAPARVWATALQRPPRMIGRTRELQALRQAVADRRALLLLGEAGMGKSRLLAEGLEGAAGHVLVKAQAGDAGVPYATLARLLRRLLEQQRVQPEPGALARLLPELGSAGPVAAVPLPADGERLMLQAAVERVLLQAGLQVVAVDDLHFADDASLEMLTALAGSDALAHNAWVFTQRPGEGSAAAAALRDVLEEAQRLDAVDVAPLDAGQMSELVQSLNLPEIDAQAIGERMLRHTGGNPLFALETLKQMLLPGAGGKLLPQPASVGTLIDRRLKHLSEGAMALARVAAVSGVDFSIALAEHVIGSRAVSLADAWGELEGAQVLRDAAFAHDLVLDAVQRSIPAHIGQHLHGQLAQWLSERQGEPARIAAHWQSAGEARLAAEAWVTAAHAADRCLRYRESVQCFEQAAALYESLADGPARHEALHGVVDQAALLDLAVDDYAAKVDRYIESAPDEKRRAAALIYRLRLLEMKGDSPAMLREADLAVTLAQAEDLKQTEAYALFARGTALGNLQQPEVALPDFERVAQIGAQTGDLETEGGGHASCGTMLIRLGRTSAALERLEAARAIFLRCGSQLRLIMIEQQRSVIHLGCGRPNAALDAADTALRDALRSDASLDLTAHCRLARAMALRHLGRYAESLAAIEPHVGELDTKNNWVADRLHLELAQSYVHLGRADLAQRSLAQARVLKRLSIAEQQRALYVELQLRALGTDRALHAGRPPPPSPAAGGEPRRRCEVMRALAALLPATQRAALLDDALRTASDFDLIDERCTAQAALAQHLLEAGQVQAARELIRIAILDEAIVPAGYPPAVAAIARAVLCASGEHIAARRVLDSAVKWIEQALSGLPPGFRSSFLERNPVNRQLLEAVRIT